MTVEDRSGSRRSKQVKFRQTAQNETILGREFEGRRYPRFECAIYHIRLTLKNQLLDSMPPFASAVLLTSIVGLLIPSILIRTGFDPFLSATFTIAMLAFATDALVTSLGMNQSSVTEVNPILNLLTRVMKPSSAIILTRLFGIAILLYGLLVLQSAYLLFAVAWLYLMIVFLSTIAIQRSSSRSAREFLVREDTP